MLPVMKEKLVETIGALQQDSVAAFELLYKSYEARLFAFSYKLVQDKEEAAEVVQEVFIKLWEKRHFLDPEQNFDGYLFQIARNLVYNKARRRVYEFAFNKYLAEQEVYATATEDAMAFEEISRLLEEVYNTLPPVRKKVFMMSRIEGLSNSEIAAQLNTSSSNIENHINKAIKAIKEKFKTYEIIYVLLLLHAAQYATSASCQI
ncbi:RNA polymerase sigma-70 factor [Pontibacter qinzhouensis]|uniref:RNA polymerase sigma-70 factor n=2 Tax=Pontibacter qinzhouensis TaxID=2603253 RepID=A0A5C8IZ05_9BACT|nr:RNA polymerase sigma-70 factor [Pontibacter qinzhouensis]